MSPEGDIFFYEVFVRMYLPLALEVYNKLIIDILGFMGVDEIKKHLFGLKAAVSVFFTSFTPTGVSYHNNKKCPCCVSLWLNFGHTLCRI